MPGTEHHKMVYDVTLRIAIDEIDSAAVRIKRTVYSKKGMIVEASLNKTVCRVPAKRLEQTLQQLSALGKVRYKNIVAKDVTDTYYDFKIRLENAQKANNRYLELLKRANNVTDILRIEKEVERLTEKIETLKARLDNLDRMIDYSTITIEYSRREKPGLIGYIGVGLYHSVKWLFVRN
ncbi:hypothetical protein FUAX_32480 [Fulvitalea axinellae]|uniref:DUF4349 domain-containing protein n=2 Tax=Fulvitalea axinellae TaxID=1182444 RepID=A0AAU9CNW6_9BACT|nr:hypothetical protein FUAX_32480 [Fulvitalea axinellae]